jgi:predicted aldo/keto reductase-like oxidoreductase
MKFLRLGKTDLQVSRVGMGGIPLTRPEEDEAVRVIHQALDLGINWIDTSIAYGPSEARIGKAIAGRRGEVIVATKGTGDKNSVLRCVEASLKRLGTDYIDLWQFHGVNTFDTYEALQGPNGGLEGTREALEAGKIRHVGMSSHALDVALKAVSSGLFETIQFPFNIIASEAARELVPLAAKNDMGFIAMKPFAGGRVRKAGLAIKYLLQFEGVFPDPGIEKVNEIDEVVDIVENQAWTLTPEELREIEDLRARVGTRFCRQCEYCMPCEQGVHIASLMYLPILYEVWPREWFLNWGYVKQGVASADNCIECGECEEKCPYQLPIREMIAEHLAFYESVRS